MDRAPYTTTLTRLLDELTKLPGVGKRSAQRIAFHLLKSPPEEARDLARAISEFRANLRVCPRCGNPTETAPPDVCLICADPRRDQGLVLVVEQPSDVASFETAGLYKGVYHVLMGRLSPLDGLGPGELNIGSLLERVQRDGVREVIIGTNPTLEGDGTALYLARKLSELGVKVTRLARGLPTGQSLETVSKAVLADALAGRQDMKG